MVIVVGRALSDCRVNYLAISSSVSFFGFFVRSALSDGLCHLESYLPYLTDCQFD